MSNSRQTLIALPAIALLALSLAACGAGSDNASGDASETNSPLGDLLGWNDIDPVESRRQQLAIEESIAVCMRQEGFEYTPVDYEAQFSTEETDEDIALYSDPEAFGKKYGYGVVRNYELYEEPYIGEGGDGGFGGPQFEDPNGEYVNSLSPDEQEAYYAALSGDPIEEPAIEDSAFDDGEVTVGTTESFSPPLEEQGCYGVAQLEVVGVNPGDDPDVQAALNDYFESSGDDPRLEAAYTEWADCMAEPLQEVELPDGMTVDTPDNVYLMMESKKGSAMGQRALPLDPETGEPIGDYDRDLGYSSSFQNEDGTGFALVGEQKVIPADELERLRTFELKFWADDWECQEEVGLQDLRIDLEQQAADDLVAEFPELAADG